MLTAVTGINWGDEGKGRVIDLLAEQADVVVRYQGGNNAGHTVVTTQGKFVLNLLPSGILHPGVVCVLGDGMVVDLEHLSREIHEIEKKGIRVTPDHLKLSKRATVMGNMEAGNMYEMYGVAAGVIGGVSPLGGTGILLGTFAGAAVWQTLENGLNMIGAQVGIQRVVIGVIVVAAVLLDVVVRNGQFGKHRKK